MLKLHVVWNWDDRVLRDRFKLKKRLHIFLDFFIVFYVFYIRPHCFRNAFCVLLSWLDSRLRANNVSYFMTNCFNSIQQHFRNLCAFSGSCRPGNVHDSVVLKVVKKFKLNYPIHWVKIKPFVLFLYGLRSFFELTYVIFFVSKKIKATFDIFKFVLFLNPVLIKFKGR